LTCQLCTREKTITLVNGQACCTWCKEYMLECESRYLLGLPLQVRREMLNEREYKRGKAAVGQLKAKMNEMFKLKQTALHKNQ